MSRWALPSVLWSGVAYASRGTPLSRFARPAMAPDPINRRHRAADYGHGFGFPPSPPPPPRKQSRYDAAWARPLVTAARFPRTPVRDAVDAHRRAGRPPHIIGHDDYTLPRAKAVHWDDDTFADARRRTREHGPGDDGRQHHHRRHDGRASKHTDGDYDHHRHHRRRRYDAEHAAAAAAFPADAHHRRTRHADHPPPPAVFPAGIDDHGPQRHPRHGVLPRAALDRDARHRDIYSWDVGRRAENRRNPFYRP